MWGAKAQGWRAERDEPAVAPTYYYCTGVGNAYHHHYALASEAITR